MLAARAAAARAHAGYWPLARSTSLRGITGNFQRRRSRGLDHSNSLWVANCAMDGAQNSSATTQVRQTIALTPDEEELFSLLLAAARRHGLNTTIRCAGGWVRDKLLGGESSDIDIALDDMLGKDFAEKVNEYMCEKGKEVAGVGVIKSNPSQSKHLETATMKVNGIWIDLVNLRSESYADSSRIPEMEFGTPAQDALRRDLTINALFYNANTKQVEDFTGSGLQDLRAGIIRTPLDPLTTFMDDPLRVLRAVRFAARLGFKVDDALCTAARSEEVRRALEDKVSRERIGVEVQGMLRGPRPVFAMKLLHSLGLHATVFCTPPDLAPVAENLAAKSIATLEAVLEVDGAVGTSGALSEDARRVMMLSAVLCSLRRITVGRGKKEISLHTFLIKESLKLRGKDAEQVEAVLQQSTEVLRVLQRIHEPSGGTDERVRSDLGLCIRRSKDVWPVVMRVAPVLLLDEAEPVPGSDQLEDDAETRQLVRRHLADKVAPGASVSWKWNAQPGLDSTATPGDDLERLSAAMSRASQDLLRAVDDFGLEGCASWRPLLDGGAVMRTLGMRSGGPALGQAMHAVLEVRTMEVGYSCLSSATQFVHAREMSGAPRSINSRILKLRHKTPRSS